MQDLLVRATSLGDWDAGVRCAARIAASQRAALTALYVVPGGLPAMPASAWDGGEMAAAYAVELAREVREAEQRAPAFAAWASSMGVPHPTWLASAGEAADAFAYVGNWHDLLVLPLDNDGEDPWSAAGGVARIVLRAALPCLVLPRGADVPERCDVAAVAFNGSVESIRALHAALPLLREARRVVMLAGDRQQPLAPLPDFPLEAWCERHLPHVEYAPLDPGAEGAGILQAAQAAGAQLLAMGAYGRSRFSEWVLGGVTRHMLLNAGIPLLMRH
ncbi:MAG TPA: universal stress protein [Xanthomonadaceae bacterium]|nr:universal stress protein [Xanthomonadaceae bacterium]